MPNNSVNMNRKLLMPQRYMNSYKNNNHITFFVSIFVGEKKKMQL
jgi:hypothetical protein